MAYIYKITNDINNKLYIGLTFNSIEQRWKTHLSDKNKDICKNRPLYRAMNKYGIEHFSIEMIEQCDDSIANEREKYWIKFYGSFHKGYNATLGGEGTIKYDREQIRSLYQQGYTIKEICNLLGCDHDVPHKALAAIGINAQKIANQKHKELYGKKCACTSKDGSITKTFLSLSDGARYIVDNGFSKDSIRGVQTHIGQTCNGQRKSAYGFYWHYI